MNLGPHEKIAEAISCLTHAVRQHTEACKNEWERTRSRSGLLTKEDLIEMEKRMALKLSELKGKIGGLEVQVEKIWGEQQKRYDDLVVEFQKFKDSLKDADVPEDAATALTAFEAKLNAFDENIPDLKA